MLRKQRVGHLTSRTAEVREVVRHVPQIILEDLAGRHDLGQKRFLALLFAHLPHLRMHRLVRADLLSCVEQLAEVLPRWERLDHEDLGRRGYPRGQALRRLVGRFADDVAGALRAQFIEYWHDDRARVEPAIVEVQSDGLLRQLSRTLQPVHDLGGGDDLPSVF